MMGYGDGTDHLTHTPCATCGQRHPAWNPCPEPLELTRIPMAPCPVCAVKLEAITGLGAPDPGAVMVCGHCRAILILTAEGSFRLLSNAAWFALSRETRELITRIREAIPIGKTP